MTFKILPHSTLRKYSLLWGNILEMLFLSLGLAYRIVILDRQKKSAQLKAKEKERYHLLLRVVLHDIANPMTVLKSYHNMISKAFQSNQPLDKVKNYFEKSKPSIEVISDIIQSVRNQEVNYNRNSQNELSSVDLEFVIKKCVEALDENLIKKDIQINYPKIYNNVIS